MVVAVPGDAKQIGIAETLSFQARAIFNNLRAGRDAMRGVEAPRSEIIFRENIPGADS